MSSRKRQDDGDGFLGNHFSSGGKLGVGGESIRGAGPDYLKETVLSILQEGETVTRALKRLRPPPKQAAGNKKRRLIGGKQRQVQQDAKAAADSFLSELEGPDAAAQEQEAENKRQFERLTEAAGELLDLGFEDIYQDSREAIAATLTGDAATGQNKRTYIWHDDGLTAPRQQDLLNNIASFKDLPRAPEQQQQQESQQEAAAPSGRHSDAATTAAAGVAGAVQYHTAVPHSYGPSQPSSAPAAAGTVRDSGQASAPGGPGGPPPAMPKMAPLPPPPPGQQAPGAASAQQQPAPAAQGAAYPTWEQHQYAPAPYAYPPPYDASYHQQWHAQQYAGYPGMAGPLAPGGAGQQQYAPPAPGAWPPQPYAQHPAPHAQYPPGQPHWGSAQQQQGPAG